jgi:membrane protease subunit HflK
VIRQLPDARAQEHLTFMAWNSGGTPPSDGPTPGPWGAPPDGQRPGPRPVPGGGGRRGPGGGGPRNPFGGPTPDLDAIIARLQAQLRELIPGGAGAGRGLILLGAAAVALWLASGFYRVQPDELGIVLRFGAYNRSTPPGLSYHLPWPVETVERPSVTHVNRVEIGFRSGGARLIESGRDQSGRDVLEESLMLTGDENIIDIDFIVLWRVANPVDYLFGTRNPDQTVKAVAESAMREVIGRTPIQQAFTEQRAQIEAAVMAETQTVMNAYKAGVEVLQVQLQKSDPPDAVIESFNDVQRANTDADRMRNEADSYRNDIVPRARGDAARIVAEAEGARQASIAEATGQTQRFLSVFKAYSAAREVTMRRMYIETLEDVLTRSPSVVVDGNLRGLVPFLPLNDLPKPPPAPTAAAPSSAGGPAR